LSRSNARSKIWRFGLLMPSASEIRMVSNMGERARHASLAHCIRRIGRIKHMLPDVNRYRQAGQAG
jgi:hypothetical protein